VKTMTTSSNVSSYSWLVTDVHTETKAPVYYSKLEIEIRKIIKSRVAEGILKKTKENMKRKLKREKHEKKSLREKIWRWLR